MRRHTNSSSDPKNTNLPVLVHCSAGVGRTGVVILSEIMIACLEHNEVHMSCAYRVHFTRCSGQNAHGYQGKLRALLTVGMRADRNVTPLLQLTNTWLLGIAMTTFLCRCQHVAGQVCTVLRSQSQYTPHLI